MLRHLGY